MPGRITQAPSPDFTNRWVELSNAQHHRLNCITSSKLKFLADGHSLHNFYETYVLKTTEKRKTSPEMIFGTIAHLAVLEPEKFNRVVRVCDLSPSTNEYKEFKRKLSTPRFSDLSQDQQKILVDRYNESLIQGQAALKRKKKPIKQEQVFEDTLNQEIESPENLENSDFQKKLLEFYEPIDNSDGSFVGSDFEDVFLVSSEEYEIFLKYQKAVQSHEKMKNLLPTLIPESSGIAQDPQTGLWLALRGDWRSEKYRLFVDIKTIRGCLTESAMQSYGYRLNHQIQAAHYLETANLIDPNHYNLFLFLFLSKDPPYEIALTTLHPTNMMDGIDSRRKYLNRIKQCEDQGKWPCIDYNDGQNYMVLKMYTKRGS
jgi:hypothetical protein